MQGRARSAHPQTDTVPLSRHGVGLLVGVLCQWTLTVRSHLYDEAMDL